MSKAQNRPNHPAESMAGQTKQCVRDHAMASAAVAFGMGVGTGLALVSLLADARPESRAAVAERLGRQFLDAIRNHVPTSLMPH